MKARCLVQESFHGMDRENPGRDARRRLRKGAKRPTLGSLWTGPRIQTANTRSMGDPYCRGRQKMVTRAWPGQNVASRLSRCCFWQNGAVMTAELGYEGIYRIARDSNAVADFADDFGQALLIFLPGC